MGFNRHILCLGLLATATAEAFTLTSPERSARLVLAPGEATCVRLAVQDLASDVRKITGRSLEIVDGGAARAGDVWVRTTGTGPWESSEIAVRDGVLTVTGADARGTMFALYDFIERYLGVDPLAFWSGVPYPKREALAWDEVRVSRPSPSVRFRGWFINDEDLLTKWRKPSGRRDYLDYRYYKDVMSVETAEAIAEALVRSRFNMVIPDSFVNVSNPPEAAILDVYARRGVFLTMHHIEPMGTSGHVFKDYWKARGKDLAYSYCAHPAEVEEVWRAQAKAWRKYPNVIWQLGLRGANDRPMWRGDPAAPADDAGRAAVISRAMARQVAILDELGVDPATRLTSVTLWGEGAEFHTKGLLEIPARSLVVFADNNAGWRWQRDFHETPRDPARYGYGVYYHHQLYSCGPHAVALVPAEKTAEMMRTAAAKGSADYAIFNVGNVREFAAGIAATARLTWDLDAFDPAAWRRDWLAARLPTRTADWLKVRTVARQALGCHPESGLPMFMDGQLVRRIDETCGRLTALLDGTDKRPGNRRKPASPSARAAGRDAFSRALADTYPRLASAHAENRLLSQQRKGYEQAVRLGEALWRSAPEAERAFAYDQIVYPTRVMLELSEASLRLFAAEEALRGGNRSAAAGEVRAAEASFARLETAIAQYCHDQWTDWYRGCEKIDFRRLADKVRHLAGRFNGKGKHE